MNPYTILVVPARRWFGGRAQWKFSIIAGNTKNLSDRDTYANVGDIETAMTNLVNSDIPVYLEVHYRNGAKRRARLR
ncbi:hypothetical protein ORI20_13815 [Mycobacterium sp. CVI_P3]|uniref:Uncharacterized protein n=1 Tax=Mycobacterium pinniadriaticum TaxID=2994102 RepID=A0ABT3SFV7_9MYCO|nr:hypothetical protein [Mycobacterium pinniadriaticum]MCX2931356.1 hypothetical protein [Mycobacterium pinniadriaticum]MCX2937780.1 hypothetical protein [Mycobacterium pinniadriaticum]